MIQRHGAYYLVVRGKYTRLAADYGPALIKYAELVGNTPRVTTISETISHYLETSVGRLAPATLENYRYSAARIAPVFGHMLLDQLKPADVYRYLIEQGTVAANRDRALLSVAYTHARNIGAFAGDDPAKGLNYRNPEKARKRYLTDDELATLIASASPKLACILQFSYLTGMRQGDTLRLRLTDITDAGIAYTSAKTDTQTLVGWTDDLRECVDQARKLWRRFGREYLFESAPKGKHAKRGFGPYTTSGLRALWRTARDKSGVADVRLHDLRRKAGSDILLEDDARALLGHTDSKVTRKHYRAKPTAAKPVR